MELKGKRIAFLGDSITEGHGVSDIAGCRYDNRLLRMAELGAVYNHGIGGTRIAYQTKPSEKPRYDLCFCGRVWNLEKDADIIVVFGGTNDFGHGDAPFGEMTDKTPASFLGGVDYLMTYLRENHPSATVVFMTPARRADEATPRKNSEHRSRPYYLSEFVQGIKQKGTEHGVAVLDLHESLGIDPANEEERSSYTTDGLHFNNDGHAFIARALYEFLVNL